MKLIIQINRIAAVATDDYTGPEDYITAPEGFDIERLSDYRVVDGVLTLPPPASVSLAQGKAALIAAGLWPAVLAYVAAIADPTDKALAEVALNDTQDWRRDSLFLNSAATALGMTSAQLDQLFVDASGIVF